MKQIRRPRFAGGRPQKYTAHGPVRRGRPLTSQTAFGGQLPYKGSLVRPAVIFNHNPFEYNGEFLRVTNHEQRLFLGLRCGVPPRQTQTNNDASGSPQRVAGRPPLSSAWGNVMHLIGQNVLGDPYGIAYRR